jgi:hypothetical protein
MGADCTPRAMTEPVVALRELLRSLREHEVDCILFGAAGLLFYGYARHTEDLDLIVSPDRENLERVTTWLRSLDAALKLNPERSFGAREQWRLQKGANATVLTRLGQVDIVQTLPGLAPWDELVRDCEEYEVDDMRVRVLNRRTLIELKRRRGSAQDLADIEAIAQLEEL